MSQTHEKFGFAWVKFDYFTPETTNKLVKNHIKGYFLEAM